VGVSREEINRKLLHTLSGTLIPGAILYLPKIPGVSPQLPMIILAVILAGSIALELIRFRVPAVQKVFFAAAGSMLRKEEGHRFTGSTYIFASAFLCTVLFAREPHISFMVLSMFILGDAVAALVGQSIGRTKVGDKSLEGSAACLLLCLVLCVVVYPRVPGLLDAWEGAIPLVIIALASLSTTVLELFPVRISRTIVLNDNLTVPIVTGLLMKLLYPLV
jgi:dolichol kinase